MKYMDMLRTVGFTQTMRTTYRGSNFGQGSCGWFGSGTISRGLLLVTLTGHTVGGRPTGLLVNLHRGGGPLSDDRASRAQIRSVARDTGKLCHHSSTKTEVRRDAGHRVSSQINQNTRHRMSPQLNWNTRSGEMQDTGCHHSSIKTEVRSDAGHRVSSQINQDTEIRRDAGYSCQINQDTEIRRDAGYSCHRSTKTQRSGEMQDTVVTDQPRHRDQERCRIQLSQINQDTEIRRDAGYGCHRSTKTQRSGEMQDTVVTDQPRHRDQERYRNWGVS